MQREERESSRTFNFFYDVYYIREKVDSNKQNKDRQCEYSNQKRNVPKINL